MFKLKNFAIAFFSAALLMTFALYVYAEELQVTSVSVRGLVVSSGHGLLINDGVRDFILLGVDASDYEGKICEAFGVIGVFDGLPAINVEEIIVIADGYPDDDLVGENQGLGSLGSNQCTLGGLDDVSVSSGIITSSLYGISLPLREGSGMRVLKTTSDSRTACRFQHSSIIRIA